MPNFKGFNTINQYKKFSLTDRDLIKRDLLNAFLIREGQLPGRPEVGTDIWSYIFEPLDSTTVDAVTNEVERVVGLDSRIELHEVEVSTQDNIVQVALSVSLLPDSDAETLYINFLQDEETASFS